MRHFCTHPAEALQLLWGRSYDNTGKPKSPNHAEANLDYSSEAQIY